MHFPFFQTEINTSLMEALLYSLLHSIWLGAIAAIIAAIILITTRHSSPLLRYHLLCVLLMMFCIGTGYIVHFEIMHSNLQQEALPFSAEITEDSGVNNKVSVNDDSAFSVNENIIQIFRKYSFLFVGLWLLVVIYKLIWFTADFKMLGKIRNGSTGSPGTDWEKRLAFLSSCVGINSTVLLKLSSETTVPMVIGVFKPIIIFPLVLFNSLSNAEAEAILLHELAHIRRQDFLVNILQRLTEIIFFFNPPVCWISELIRRERENCCDDIAISVTQDKRQYIYALVAFQEHHLNNQQGQLYTAFPGDGHQVFNRVNRILTNHNKSLNKMEKVFLASAIFFTVIVTLAFSSHEKTDKAFTSKDDTIQNQIKSSVSTTPAEKNDVLQQAVRLLTIAEKDTLPLHAQVKRKSIMVYSTNINGKEYELHKNENEIVQLKIDGKVIPLNQLNSYRAALDTIDNRLDRDEREMENNLVELQLNEELLSRNNEAKFENQLNEAQLRKMQTEASLALQQNLLGLKEVQIENMLRNNKQFTDTLLLKELSLLHSSELKELALSNNLHLYYEKFRSEQLETHAEALQEHKLALIEHQNALAKQHESMQQHNRAMGMIDELVNEGIIENSRNLKLKLTNNELIINGKKQSAELHLRMLKKVQDKTGGKVNLEYNITN